MHGLGNDFIVFDAPESGAPSAEVFRRLADRYTGIGFDQALMLEPPRRPGTAAFYRIFNADGREVEQRVTGGLAKLQWKPDWGMRWAALGVDYEMSGKDLIPSFELASKICRILGAPPPEGFTYELFLDEKGEKISKSKGNGLSVEEWLAYAPPESLALFMYMKPRAAKRLYFDVIPRAVDDYLAHLESYHGKGEAERMENPLWHIHDGNPPPRIAWPHQ